MNDPKPGVKTTEFIMTLMPWLVTLVLLALVGIDRVELADIQWVLAALGIGGGISNAWYSGARAKIKTEA